MQKIPFTQYQHHFENEVCKTEHIYPILEDVSVKNLWKRPNLPLNYGTVVCPELWVELEHIPI